MTRDHVLHTALELIDRQGVDGLSMRKLGHALNRDPMGLYRHAENKAALLDAVTELVLEGVVVPAIGVDGWERALRLAAQSFRLAAIAHPRMVPLLVTRPVAQSAGLLAPSSLRWLEGVLGVLAEAGFDSDGALQAYRFFTGFLAGHLLHEIRESAADSAPGRPGDGSSEQIRHAEDFPWIGALSRPPGRYNGKLELIVGLDILMTGFRHQLATVTNAHQPTK